MCGISAYLGKNAVKNSALICQAQEHRGKLGSGVAFIENQLKVFKTAESPTFLLQILPPSDSTIAIGHNRQPAGSPVAVKNSHPFANESRDLALVHNGILSDHQLRVSLQKIGHKYTSETDSESILHLLEYFLSDYSFKKAMAKTLSLISRLGSSAFLVLNHEGEVWGTRDNMPIVLLDAEDYTAVASESSSFTALGLEGETLELYYPFPYTIFKITEEEIIFYGKFEKKKTLIQKPFNNFYEWYQNRYNTSWEPNSKQCNHCIHGFYFRGKYQCYNRNRLEEEEISSSDYCIYFEEE